MDLSLASRTAAPDLPVEQELDAERQLVERARTQRDAFALLYRRHYAAIGRYLMARTCDPHATEDLLAETFLAALRGLGTYRYRGVPFRWWLMRIATNAVNRWARRERRRAVPLEAGQEPTAPAGGAERALEAGDERERVHALLLRLAPRHQSVLVLYYLEELEVAAIARVLGCRPGTVKSRLARARVALRRLLPEMS